MAETSEMIERVAKALLKARFYDYEPGAYENDLEKFFKVVDPDHVEAAEYEARAAIEAMREPSKQMIAAGDEEKEACIDQGADSDADGNSYPYTYINSDLPARVFRAMIAAALPED